MQQYFLGGLKQMRDEDWDVEGFLNEEISKKSKHFDPVKNSLRKKSNDSIGDYLDDAMEKEEIQEIMMNLFQLDIWDERLLSFLFVKVWRKVLHPRERALMELLIEGKSEDYIFKLLRNSSPQHHFERETITIMKNAIKVKLKDGFVKELPGWIRGKVWEKDHDDE